jgi:hypothetical protein
VSVTITTSRQAMEQLVADARREVAEDIHETTDRAVGKIRADWPVDTGASRDAWRAEDRGEAAAVVNGEAYVQHVNGGRAVAQALATWEAEVAAMGRRE